MFVGSDNAMLTAELLALLSAALFPLGLIFLKKGFYHATPIYGTIVVTAINAVVLGIAAALFSHTAIFLSSAIVFFILGGVIGQGIARYLQFIAVHLIGPARNTTALATSAIFSSVIAVIFRGEKWTLPVFFGTLAIVGGIAFLANESKKTKWKLEYLAIPIVAAFLYGIMNNLYKEGFEKMPDALFGGAVGLTASLATLLIIAAATSLKNHRTIKIPKMNRALPFFFFAGILNSLALILNFEALKLGDVTVVYPLINAQPLFATLFGYLFLRQTEKINLHVVSGAVIMVVGIVLITVF